MGQNATLPLQLIKIKQFVLSYMLLQQDNRGT
jgi:hypothetical protein